MLNKVISSNAKSTFSDVMRLFFMGFTKGSLVTRASAAAYNLFLALIPSVIFLFTLIPFVPMKNFQPELLAMIYDFIPESVYRVLESTIIMLSHKKAAFCS